MDPLTSVSYVLGVPPQSICTESDKYSANALVAQIFLALTAGLAAQVCRDVVSRRALLITASVGGFTDLADSVIGRCGQKNAEPSLMTLFCLKGALRAAVILWGLHAAKSAPELLCPQTLPLAVSIMALAYDAQHVMRNSPRASLRTWALHP
jgi:hypothetical protein